jgi:hypothetical protein
MRRFGQKIIRQVFWPNRIKVIRRFRAIQIIGLSAILPFRFIWATNFLHLIFLMEQSNIQCCHQICVQNCQSAYSNFKTLYAVRWLLHCTTSPTAPTVNPHNKLVKFKLECWLLLTKFLAEILRPSPSFNIMVAKLKFF